MDLIQYSSDNKPVYPVYILKRVVDQLVEYCKQESPVEALGILIGWHHQLSKPDSEIKFTKIIDWVTGEVNASHIGAQFTEKGIIEYNTLLDEKYGANREGPNNIGLFHSHPFGFEPHFSGTDFSTFLVFPYNAENNVFILIDPVPVIPYFKVFQLKLIEAKLKLIQVPWIEYSPIQKDFEGYTYLKSENDTEGQNQESSLTGVENKNEEVLHDDNEDSYFNPPEIQDIDKNGNTSLEKKKKSTLKDYF